MSTTLYKTQLTQPNSLLNRTAYSTEQPTQPNSLLNRTAYSTKQPINRFVLGLQAILPHAESGYRFLLFG